jgi:hypothetical protein
LLGAFTGLVVLGMVNRGGISMIVGSPEQAVVLLDRALNKGDLEGALEFYEDCAVVVTEPR